MCTHQIEPLTASKLLNAMHVCFSRLQARNTLVVYLSIHGKDGATTYATHHVDIIIMGVCYLMLGVFVVRRV